MLKLKIVSPEKVVYDGPVEKVQVPGTMGLFEILENHAPLISSLEKGTIVYTTGEGQQEFAITGGFVAIKKNDVSVCVEI